MSVPEQNNQDRELLRAIFRDEITDNDVLAAFDRIAIQGSKTVKELRSMRKAFDDFRDDLTTIAALMTCAVLAVGNKDEQDALRNMLDSDDEDEDETEPQQDNPSGAKVDGSDVPIVKYALRTDIDMNEVMRAAIAATEEDPATVGKVTEAIVAYLKSQMKSGSFLAKRFMAELDAATVKRVKGSTDPTDFDPVVTVIKVALTSIVTAVADATEIDRTVVDRIAFAELLAVKKMLVNTSRVTTGEEAERMVQDLTETRKTQDSCDANGVEVE
ncbi:MAG: hypothetical protein PHV21_06900 [Synergistaceae bacterium]|nr:hypothetical protein [Synergistaceae bacterium]